MLRFTAALLTLLAVSPAFADDTVSVNMRALVVGKTGRMLFNPSEMLSYQARIDGANLIVRFEKPIQADAADALRPLGDLIAGVTKSSDGRTLTFGLRQQASIHTYQSNGPIVIDVIPSAPAPTPVAAPPPPPGPPPAPAARANPFANVPKETVRVRAGAHPGFNRVVFDWKTPVSYTTKERNGAVILSFDRPVNLDTSRIDPRRALFVAPSEGNDGPGKTVASIMLPPGGTARHYRSGNAIVLDLYRATAEQPAVAKTTRTPDSEAETAPTPEAAAKPDAAPEQDKAGPKLGAAPPASGAKTAMETSVAAAEPPPAQAARPSIPPPSKRPEKADRQPPPAATPALPADAMPVRLTRDDASGGLVFPWKTQVKAAAFRRAGYVWIVFDRAVALDLSALAAGQTAPMRIAEQISHPTATVVRVEAPPDMEPKMQHDGAAWVVGVRPRGANPTRILTVQRDTTNPDRLLIPVVSPSPPIELRDPDVGDRIVVVAVQPVEMGMPETRDYPELQLLATSQGIAVTTVVDPLQVVSRDRGVEISTPRGLYLNDEKVTAPPMRGGRSSVEEWQVPLLDLARWQRPKESYFDARQGLQRAVSEAGKDTVNAARLDLARFYLGRGLAAEALGEMGLVAESAPELFDEPSVRLLRGASALLAGNLKDAETDLMDPVLDPELEAMLWRGLLAAKRSEWDKAVPFLRRTWKMIAAYPPWLQKQFVLAGTEAAIDKGDLKLAASWLDQIDAATAPEPLRSRLLYLKGRLLAARGAIADATSVWDQVAAGPDRYSRARAALAKIELRLAEGASNRPEAIEALEKLRFAWRGDSLEYAILKRLGETYLQQGDYWNGLTTLREGATVFAEDEKAAELTYLMRAGFRNLFASGQATGVSPLKMLALYQEFRDLMPEGEDGDTIMRDLAGRLVGLELLEPAASLLDERLRKMPPSRQGEAAADIALIRLLDHKPQRALEALDLAPADATTDGIGVQRRVLRARALFDLGRSEDALAGLGGDDSRAAAALRADIYWKTAEWASAARAYERLARAMPEGTPSADQGRTILKLAVATSLAGDRAALQRLQERYSASVAGTPFEGAFRLIAAGQPTPGQSLQSVTTALADVDAFQSVLKEYRDAFEKRAAPHQS